MSRRDQKASGIAPPKSDYSIQVLSHIRNANRLAKMGHYAIAREVQDIGVHAAAEGGHNLEAVTLCALYRSFHDHMRTAHWRDHPAASQQVLHFYRDLAYNLPQSSQFTPVEDSVGFRGNLKFERTYGPMREDVVDSLVREGKLMGDSFLTNLGKVYEGSMLGSMYAAGKETFKELDYVRRQFDVILKDLDYSSSLLKSERFNALVLGLENSLQDLVESSEQNQSIVDIKSFAKNYNLDFTNALGLASKRVDKKWD